MAKVKTSISLDNDVFDYVSMLAGKEARSFSQQLTYMLRKVKEGAKNETSNRRTSAASTS